MPEIHSDRSRSRHRRPNKDSVNESFDSTDELEEDPVVLERREKQARYIDYLIVRFIKGTCGLNLNYRFPR